MNVFSRKTQQRLNRLFQKEGILFAYLFGSAARGDATIASDIDIAVLLPKNTSRIQRFTRRLKLIRALAKILKKNIDVIIINDISLLFRYAIVHEGILLYQKNELARVEFENRTLAEYFDFAPFLETYNRQYVKDHL